MPKITKSPTYRGVERYNPLKGIKAFVSAEAKEKAEAKAAAKRRQIINVALVYLDLLKIDRVTRRLGRASNTFNEIQNQLQNLSLNIVEPETEPANFNSVQEQAQEQAQE
jgi:hypothetical protein